MYNSVTRRTPRQFHFIPTGFTLVEMLVAISIMAVLAALIVPNLAKYVSTSKSAVQKNELAEIQHDVSAAMADAGVNQIAGAPLSFGNTGHASPPSATDLTIGSQHLGDYISGGLTECHGEYQVAADGTVSQVWYPP